MQALTHVDAEKTMLGCILLDPGCLYRVLPLVKAQDFSLDSHRRIYHAIAELAEAGKPVDDMTVTDALIAKGQLDVIGGVGYLVTLSDNVTSELARTANVEHYAELVLDKSRRRQARAAGQCLINATDDLSVPTGDCIERVQESLLEIEAASGKTAARHAREFMPEVLRELETQSQNRGLVGVTTGIPSLDLATGGIRLGELTVIANEKSRPHDLFDGDLIVFVRRGTTSNRENGQFHLLDGVDEGVCLGSKGASQRKNHEQICFPHSGDILLRSAVSENCIMRDRGDFLSLSCPWSEQ
jgi:replicative DNA helicase